MEDVSVMPTRANKAAGRPQLAGQEWREGRGGDRRQPGRQRPHHLHPALAEAPSERGGKGEADDDECIGYPREEPPGQERDGNARGEEAEDELKTRIKMALPSSYPHVQALTALATSIVALAP
jgi:hypothetical protein